MRHVVWGTLECQLTTCAEENISLIASMEITRGRYLGARVRAIPFTTGITPVDPTFNDRLQRSLDNAIEQGRWLNTYAATNIWEYWAEGVQSWFDVNAEVESNEGDGKHNRVNTREELKIYDPGLYEIISAYFPETNERISRHKPENRYNFTLDESR